MTERDQEEQDLRIDQMTINIEKLRADIRWESRKFVLQAVVALAAAIGVGVGIGNLIWNHPGPALQLPPGTSITTPRAG